MFLEILMWALYLGSCVWVFIDARIIKSKIENREEADRISPAMWSLGVFLLWFIFFPFYLWKRYRYLEQDFSFKSPSTIGGLAVVAFFVIYTIMAYTGGIKMGVSDLQVAVEQNMLKVWEEELEVNNIKVNSFALFHISGNQYEGMMDVTMGGERSKLIIDVTYDGRGFMWRVRGL